MLCGTIVKTLGFLNKGDVIMLTIGKQQDIAVKLISIIRDLDLLYVQLENALGESPETVGGIHNKANDCFFDFLGIPEETWNEKTETGYSRDGWYDDITDLSEKRITNHEVFNRFMKILENEGTLNTPKE